MQELLKIFLVEFVDKIYITWFIFTFPSYSNNQIEFFVWLQLRPVRSLEFFPCMLHVPPVFSSFNHLNYITCRVQGTRSPHLRDTKHKVVNLLQFSCHSSYGSSHTYRSTFGQAGITEMSRDNTVTTCVMDDMVSISGWAKDPTLLSLESWPIWPLVLISRKRFPRFH